MSLEYYISIEFFLFFIIELFLLANSYLIFNYSQISLTVILSLALYYNIYSIISPYFFDFSGNYIFSKYSFNISSSWFNLGNS